MFHTRAHASTGNGQSFGRSTNILELILTQVIDCLINIDEVFQLVCANSFYSKPQLNEFWVCLARQVLYCRWGQQVLSWVFLCQFLGSDHS